MKTRRVVSEYRTQYHQPIELSPGETVVLGEEEKEEKWKGWIWAETATRKGWVPMQVLDISADRRTAIVLEKYTARELDADTGDTVTEIQQLNGWSFCRNEETGKEGWLPDEILETPGN